MPTSLERVLTALHRGTPDRVPTFEWEVDDRAIAALTRGGDLFDFVEWADLDGVAIFADERKRHLTETVYVDEWGVTKAKTEEYYPVPIDAPLKQPSDLKGLKIPDPLSRMALRDTLPRGGSIQGQAGNCLPRTGCLLDSALSAWGGVGPDGFHPEPAVAARPGRDRHRVQLGPRLPGDPPP